MLTVSSKDNVTETSSSQKLEPDSTSKQKQKNAKKRRSQHAKRSSRNFSCSEDTSRDSNLLRWGFCPTCYKRHTLLSPFFYTTNSYRTFHPAVPAICLIQLYSCNWLRSRTAVVLLVLAILLHNLGLKICLDYEQNHCIKNLGI